MNLGLRSLFVRITFAISVSVFVIIVLFTVGATLLVHGIEANLVARMIKVEKEIDPLVSALHVTPENFHVIGPLIAERLSTPGVAVRVRTHSERQREEMRLEHPGRADAEGPPFEERQPPPNDLRRRFDISVAVFLNVFPKHHPIDGGEVMLIPLPTRLGIPFYLFIAEIFALGGLLIVVAGVIGRALTLRSFAPLRAVSTSLAQLADGEFSASQVQVSEDAEIRELAVNYNRAALRVKSAMEERERNEQRMRQFIADASHELRTPLTVILGYFDALSKATTNQQQLFTRAYPIISAEGQRMRVLIDNMSLLTKLDQEQVSRIEIIDLSELANEVVSALSIVASSGRLQLETQPGVLITGSRDEIFAAARNLVENAMKYAPEGPIVVRTMHQSDRAVLEVADTGPGIAAEDLPHLFTRFYRGAQRGDVTGSGLGLPIVSRAVERANGVITVDSVTPHGAAFRMTFPRCDFQT